MSDTDTLQQPTVEPQVPPPEVPTAEPQAQPTPPQEPSADVPEWAKRRFGELTAARKAAEERAVDLERRLNAMQPQQPAGEPAAPSGGGTELLIDHLAQQKAQALVQQQELAHKVQSIEKAGQEQFGGDFDRAVQNLQMAGIGSPHFLEALTYVPGAEKLIRYLGAPENMNEATRLTQLAPAAMAVELMKLAPKATAAYGKQLSSAPAPTTQITGNGNAEGAEPDPKDTNAWIAWRSQNARRKR